MGVMLCLPACLLGMQSEEEECVSPTIAVFTFRSFSSMTEEEELNDSDEDACLVCCERRVRSVAMPCGHKGVCDTCRMKLPDSCPLCRGSVQYTLSSTYGPPEHALGRILQCMDSTPLLSPSDGKSQQN